MTHPTVLTGLLLVGLSVVVAPVGAHGQGLSIDVSAGRVVYDPVSNNVGANNVMGALRYDAQRGAWVYGTAAAPMRSGDPAWGAFGTGGRFEQPGSGRRRARLGVDLGAHGFAFRDAVVDHTGRGGALEAIPFASVSTGPGRVEVRGGWRGQTLSFTNATGSRAVWETGARGIYGDQLRLQGDVKWLYASEGTFPFLGGSLIYSGVPVQIWLQAGKWLSDELNDVAWAGGVGVALGAQTTLWAHARQEAPDPLYWNAARRTWSVGVTRRLGRGTLALQPAPGRDAGGVLIRLSAADAPGESVSIAGDFNAWQAVPMQREGREWVIRLPLTPGVYNYAFRSSRGDWFVPASVAARRDDGMGGHVAVLVVGDVV